MDGYLVIVDEFLHSFDLLEYIATSSKEGNIFSTSPFDCKLYGFSKKNLWIYK